MGRWPSQIGKTLRAIVLSTPFVQAIALPACSPGMTSDDAGQVTTDDAGQQPCDGAGVTPGLSALLIAPLSATSYTDGGLLPCGTICHQYFSGIHCGEVNCAFCSNMGTPSAECTFNVCGGRRPSRLRAAPRPRASADPLAILWRDVARLEAAAVIAFRDLERELRSHHAPAALVALARRAIHDEIRHARVTSALCRSYGGRPIPPTAAGSRGVRSLKVIARENATEGCVRETFGALLALWQSRHASDLKTRHAMRRIAPDEVRHAEIAWAVASWAEPRLGASAQRDIAAARREAFVELLSSTRGRIPVAHVTVAGLPHPVAARQLAERMGEALSLA